MATGVLALASAVAAGCGPTGTTERASAFLKVMPALRLFVEKARGHQFAHAVPVEMLSAKDFGKRLNGGGRVDDLYAQRETDETVSFLRAFGLIRGKLDIAALSRAQSDNVAGFYSPTAQRLYIRIADPTLYNQMVVVHELTHALDDQYFDLDQPPSGEAGRAWQALVEGAATDVEQKFYRSRTADEQRQIDDEERREVAKVGDIPAALLQQGSFPYTAGLRFVEALNARTLVDLAYGTPPETTEQVLHPDKYKAREKALDLAGPDADGPIVREGTLGEEWLRLILADNADHDAADRAATGWGGDRYVMWRAGTRTCARVRLLMDTREDTDEVLPALHAWAARTPGASVEGDGPIVTTSCGDAA